MQGGIRPLLKNNLLFYYNHVAVDAPRIMKYTNAFKQELVEQIATLAKQEQEDIFMIFNRHQVPYTKNGNGIFINFKILKTPVLKELDAFLQAHTEKSLKMHTFASKDSSVSHDALASDNGATSSDTPKQSMGQIVDDVASHDYIHDEVTEFQQASHDSSKFQSFMEHLSNNKHLQKKNHFNKFYVAKKKYAKPFTSDTKKTDDYLANQMCPEPYLVA
jgi:hypothetical protein